MVAWNLKESDNQSSAKHSIKEAKLVLQLSSGTVLNYFFRGDVREESIDLLTEKILTTGNLKSESYKVDSTGTQWVSDSTTDEWLKVQSRWQKKIENLND